MRNKRITATLRRARQRVGKRPTKLVERPICMNCGGVHIFPTGSCAANHENATATYSVGRNAMFDPGVLQAIDAACFRVFHPYVSNWRVLHIDTFESFPPMIPAAQGISYRFTYEATHR